MVHQKQTHTHLHVKKHDGYDGPLGGFVDDVCVGEPAGGQNVNINMSITHKRSSKACLLHV